MLHEILNPSILACAEELLANLTASPPMMFRLASGDEAVPRLGLRRSARLPVLSALSSALQKPILLLTDRADRALTLLDELTLLAPNAHHLFFPEPGPLFYEIVPWGEATRRDRLVVLTRLARRQIPGTNQPGNPLIIVASARAVMTRTLPRRDFLLNVRMLRSGQILPMEELIRHLVKNGYESVSTITAPGQFARRGGILDIWPPAEELPIRLDYFGEEIEGLRRFDPSTQRSTGRIEEFVLAPAREFIVSGFSPVARERSTESFSEFHIPLLHPTAASLLNYLPEETLVVIDDLEDFRDAILDVEDAGIELRKERVERGELPSDFPLPYLTWTEVQDSLAMHPALELGPSSAPESSYLAQCFTSGPRFGGRVKLLLDHISQRIQSGDKVVVVSRQASRLKALWTESSSGDGSDKEDLFFLEGSLTEGWILTPPPVLSTKAGKILHLLTDGEIFGWRRPELRHRRRTVAEAPESAYTDLQIGDWVVHVDHGVGRFFGLVDRTVDGIQREYLLVEYAEGDQLFVPVHQADRLSRYVGPDNRAPSPSRLGGVEWRNTKSRVKEAVAEIAEDLLDLYAQRQVLTGFSFSPDTSWQQELEASFPYVETEDQVRVIAEVKRDMENPRPMDRLICGDVGYGKTEVALRAAFKAVMDGRQVAVLVPTTVLAQQHFNTFRERLAAFPVEVEMLSRFRSPSQQRAILLRLALGSIDIIIGTHRLLQDDVEFNDLGLLIIDEEQRFGVTHKEYLKKMRTTVDVLTLTATPIPRTMYMALTGVRDISTINTPPEERLPVITHVGPYSPRLVRQAILRELERGGQVFFVHNRVQTISAMRSHLERLVPEARLAIAHGQMDEAQLSRRMEQFTSGKIDILLTTSIIESGLDIPNANTLIVDRADTFGLSQLYQLRGRVGRGAQRAYAYFFKHPRRIPSPEGRQRLETIAENTQLGAGFSIAMRDLEIRGAGDILGTRQHGHIAAVGFHLYTRLLAEAVSAIRKQRGLPPVPGSLLTEVGAPMVSVDLPLHVGLPGDYVPDKNMRLRLYRRIADLRSLGEVDAVEEEFTDRFGIPPPAVRNLLYQLKIKLLAEGAGVSSIGTEDGQIAIRFRSGTPPDHSAGFAPQVRIGKTALWISYRSFPGWRDLLLNLLLSLQPSEHAPEAARPSLPDRPAENP